LRKLDFGSKVVGMLVRAEVVIESLMTREIKVVLSCGMKKIRVKVNGTMMVLLKIQEITSWKMRSTRREGDCSGNERHAGSGSRHEQGRCSG
jgi:hypothetical protein